MKEKSIRQNQRAGFNPNYSHKIPRISSKDLINNSFVKARKKIQQILEMNSPISDFFNNLYFTKDKKLYSAFCINCFPYQFFYERILADDETSLSSFQIFTIFTATKNCSLEFRQTLANDSQFTQFIFPSFATKTQFHGAESCFRLFSHLILLSPLLRDYLLNSGIMDYFINCLTIMPQLFIPKPEKERFFISSIRFFCACLSLEPIINEHFIDPITQVFHSILESQSIPVISEFVKKFKKHNQIQQMYPQIYSLLLSYVSTNYNNVDHPGIISIIYKYLRNTDSDEYYNLTMQYLVNVDSIKVRRQCLKQIILRHDDWSSSKGQEICVAMIELTPSFSYTLQILCARILLLYGSLDLLINEVPLNLIIQFVRDPMIGGLCLKFILNILCNATLTQEQQALFCQLISNENDQLFSDLINDGTIEQVELASTILEKIGSFCNE